MNLLGTEEAQGIDSYLRNKKFHLCLEETMQRIKNPIFALLYPDHWSGLILICTRLIQGMWEGIGLILFSPQCNGIIGSSEHATETANSVQGTEFIGCLISSKLLKNKYFTANFLFNRKNQH